MNTKNQTWTTEGAISHLPVALPDGTVFAAPVVTVQVKGPKGHPLKHMPVRNDGRLVFALPGGERVVL